MNLTCSKRSSVRKGKQDKDQIRELSERIGAKKRGKTEGIRRGRRVVMGCRDVQPKRGAGKRTWNLMGTGGGNGGVGALNFVERATGDGGTRIERRRTGQHIPEEGKRRCRFEHPQRFS